MICDEGVGATVVEGTAHALSCSGQTFLPIREVNAGVSVIRERTLKNGHRNGHHSQMENFRGRSCALDVAETTMFVAGGSCALAPC